MQAHRFPSYAPELNPDEFVGTQAKRELSNIDHDGLVPLTLHVIRSLQRIGRSQALLHSRLDDETAVQQIRAVTNSRATYGYRRADRTSWSIGPG